MSGGGESSGTKNRRRQLQAVQAATASAQREKEAEQQRIAASQSKARSARRGRRVIDRGAGGLVASGFASDLGSKLGSG